MCSGNLAADSEQSPTLIASEQRAATIEDTTFASGDIALTAISYEDGATKILFDDVVVYAPPD